MAGFTNVEVINKRLKQLSSDWTAHTLSNGRIYYINHHTQTSQWHPPQEGWEAPPGGENGQLPRGWETGVDKLGRPYYINHVEKLTTHSDPRTDPEYVEPPKPRTLELIRDEQLGFGFVAGSEKPVIVRFVTEGGPSEKKLLPGDQIIEINGEDVEKSPREYVIELVRSCKQSVVLTVCQPHIDNSSRKSALLTAAKKARLKSNPSRVRFAEAVIVNGAPVISPSTHESYIPFMPNVLKVFLENGQTKSFKYDNKTTVKDVMNSLQEKLSISCIEHFSLVLQNMRDPTHNKMALLLDHESLAEVASRPGSQHFKCLFRLTFVPKDAYDLLRKDATAFEYFFMQCSNDVVQGRFASELKYDIALRLAALHIQQYAICNNMQGKLTVKSIEKECGLDRFVPNSLLESMKGKELRKMISHYMKSNQNMTAPGQKQLTALQTKLHYMKIISELRSFGGKCFIATLVEKKTEAMLLVGPRCGVSVVINIKNNTLSTLAEYEQIDRMTITKESDTMQQVHLHLKDQSMSSVSMLTDEVHDFVALVEGYYRLFVEKEVSLLKEAPPVHNNNSDPAVPQYEGEHQVIATPWSYTADAVAEGGSDTEQPAEGSDTESAAAQKTVDLSKGPPSYQQTINNTDHDPTQTQEEETSVVSKPSELKTQEVLIHAPLASPDASNISGSSESSINNTGSPEQQSISSQLEDGEISLNSLDDGLTDSASLTTNSSASTVVSRGTVANGTMNGGVSSDSRFGVRTFRTFFADDEADGNTSHSNSSLSSTSSPLVTPITDNAQPSNGDLQNNNNRRTSINNDLVNELQGELKVRQSREEPEVETDSESTSEAEKRPLISCREDYQYHDNEGATIPEYLQSESDTDSVSTPTDSPSKARLESLNLNPPPLRTVADRERPHSFGLHSPDQLPKTESEFRAIASSFGLHSPDKLPTSEQLHPSYNPRLFCDGGLYLDPDIIDLTLIPPPKTPDEENLIDFSTMEMVSAPPPGFSDDSSSSGSGHSPPRGGSQLSLEDAAALPPATELPPDLEDLPPNIREKIDALVMNDEELGNQLATIDALLLEDAKLEKRFLRDIEKESGMESETDSGNETISSENVDMSAGWLDSQGEFILPKVAEEVPDIPTSGGELDDIDAFIASMAVPPPPKDSPDSDLPPPPLVDRQVSALSTASAGSDEVFPPPPVDADILPPPVAEDGEEGESNIDNLVAMAPPLEGTLEEEYAKWVIPPPPESEETALLGDIPIVPPVNVKTPVSDKSSPASDFAVRTQQEHSNNEIRRSPPENVLRAVVRPVQSLKEDYRVGPPLPPKRTSSVGEGMSCQSSPETSYPPNAKHNIWRRTDIRSADSSPVHRGKDFKDSLHGSTGTLNRIRRGGAPPAPPPRRSSIQHGQESPENSCNSSIDSTHEKSPSPTYATPVSTLTSTFQRRANLESPLHHRHSNYVNVYHSHSNSEPALCEIDRSPPSDKAHTMGRTLANVNRQSSTFMTKTTSAQDLEQGAQYSRHSMASSEGSATSNMIDEMLKKMQINSSSKMAKKVEEDASDKSSVDSDSAGNKLAPRHRSPSFTRKLLTFEIGQKDSESDTCESDVSSSSSKTLGRSHTFTNSVPKSYGSPKSSPLLQRHGSFGKLAERAASPLRSLFGHGSDRDRTSSESESGSCPASPRRTLRSSIVSTFTRSSTTKPFGSGSQGKDSHKRSGIPLKIVHPLMSTSSSDSEASPTPLHREWANTLSRDKKGTPPPVHRDWAAPVEEDSRTTQRSFSTFKSAGPRRASTSNTSPVFGRKSYGATVSPVMGRRAGNVRGVRSETSSATSSPSRHSYSTGMHNRNTFAPGSRSREERSRSNSQQSPRDTDKSSTGVSPARSNGEATVTPTQKIQPWRSIGEAAAQRVAQVLGRDRTHSQSSGEEPPQRIDSPSSEGGQNGSVINRDKLNPISPDLVSSGSKLNRTIKDILDREYHGSVTFHFANQDVDFLIKEIETTTKEINNPKCKKPGEEFTEHKEKLVSESRQFVTDSKLLVSSATQSLDKLVQNVNNSIHTLAKIVMHSQNTMLCMSSVPQAHLLGARVKDVANAYKDTVTAAHSAAGRPLSDPQMKNLMKQATLLASILSALMKILKVLENS